MPDDNRNFEVVLNAEWAISFIGLPGHPNPLVVLEFNHPRFGHLRFNVLNPAALAAQVSQVLAGEAQPTLREQMQ